MLQTLSKTQDPFEAQLNSALKEIEAHIAAGAKTDGETGMPHPHGDNLHHYFDPYLHRYYELLAKNAAWYKPQTVKMVVLSNNQDAQQKVREQLNKKADLDTRKLSCDAALEHTPEPPKFSKKTKAYVAIACLAIVDSGLNVALFETWGYSKLESWIFSPFLAAVFAFIAHIVPKAIHRIRHRIVQRAAAIVLAILLFALFLAISGERAHYLSTATGHYHSPWPIAILSTLFLYTAIAISYFYLPYSEEEKEAIRQYTKCLNEKLTVEKELEKIETTLQSVKNEKAHTEGTGASAVEAAYVNHQRIKAAAVHGLSIYKNINKRYRPDGLIPDCFDTPFQFDFPDFTIKPDTHENT